MANAESTFVIAGTGTGCAECNGLSQCASCNPSELPALVSCSTGTVCLETVYTNCVVYNGAPITCGSQTLVNTGMGLTLLIQNLYAQICAGGFVGMQGPAGAPGAPPVISVTPTVTIATTLLPPIVTSTLLSPGTYNLQFRLPAGQDGVSPNVVAYNTTTGAPGTSAIVTLDPSSTSSIKRFNFTIPRGDAGAQGIQGVSITSGIVNGAGHLIITKSDATTFDAGYVVGPAGNAGAIGAQGSPGSNSLIYKFGADAAGNVAVNTLISTAITTITVSNTSRVGYNGIVNTTVNNANAWLQSVKVNDRIQLYKSLDSSTFGVYKVLTIAPNLGNTSYIFTVSLVAGSGTFVLTNDVSVAFTLKGDKGDAGINGTNGAKGAVGPNTLVYQCNSTTVTALGKAVLNSSNLALVTTIVLNTTSMLGYTNSVASVGNATQWVSSIKTDTRIQLTDVNNSDIFGIFKVVSITINPVSPGISASYTLSVVLIASTGSLTITDQNFAISYVNTGVNGNYIVTTYITPGSDPACPHGGILVETRSGVDNTIVGTPLKLCNPKNGDYVTVVPESAGVNCANGGVKIRTFDGSTNAVLSTNYLCNAGSIGIVSNCEFNSQMTSTPTGFQFEITNTDSGWLNLLGFSHLASESNLPQVRRIGKHVFFRGVITIPMADPTTSAAIVLGSGSYVSSQYSDIAHVAIYTGTGGVTINPNGGFWFANNTTCLPSALWCNGVQPSFSKIANGGRIIAERQIMLNATGGGATVNATTKIIGGTTAYGGSLSTILGLSIQTNGAMYISTIQDVEQPLGSGLIYNGGSTMRPIVCNVKTDDFVMKWNAATTSFHGAPTGIVNSPLDADSSTLGKWLVTCDGGNPNHLGAFAFSIDTLHLLID